MKLRLFAVSAVFACAISVVATGQREDGIWKQEAGRKPEPGSRKREAGSQKQEAGSRKPEAGSRKPEAGSRQLDAGRWTPEAGNGQPTTGSWKLDAEAERWVAATLKKMSLDDKVGQLLVSSFGSEFLSTDSREYGSG